MSMAKANSKMFCRTILLLSFVAFAISLETATKHVKYVLRGEDKKGRSSAEWLEPVEERASKKVAGDEFVYLITMSTAPAGCRKVKIGHSNNPDYRRTALQVGNPWQLTVEKRYKVLASQVKEAEAAAKLAMQDYLFRGEWYNIPQDDIATVADIVSDAIYQYKV